MPLPKPAKLADPGVNLLKRFRIHGINPSGSLDAHSDEAALTQCPEMLRNARLRDAELSHHAWQRPCAGSFGLIVIP